MSAFFQKQADKLLKKVQNHQSSPSAPLPPPPLSKSKRGLCWPVENQDPIHIFTKPGSKISWIYNWSPTPTPSPNPSSLEFIPMQWNHINIEHLPKILESSPSPYVLTFNEPDLPSQANMSPELAADVWIKHIEPLRKAGYRIGSPSISNSPDGAQWLSTFLQYIRTPPPSEPGEKLKSDIDFLCLHWYGETLGQFYDYIWATHHSLDPSKKVWITEFAPTNWKETKPLPTEEVETFLRESVKYLDSLEWVERYAFFGAMRDTGSVGRGARMIDDEGRLKGLGRGYRDF